MPASPTEERHEFAADYLRIHRLLKILTLTQSRPGWTPVSLALEFGTTERTIYRDMKVLDKAGITADMKEAAAGECQDFMGKPRLEDQARQAGSQSER